MLCQFLIAIDRLIRTTLLFEEYGQRFAKPNKTSHETLKFSTGAFIAQLPAVHFKLMSNGVQTVADPCDCTGAFFQGSAGKLRY